MSRTFLRLLAAAFVSVSLVFAQAPDYTLKVVNLGRTVWSTRIVVGKPGEYATPLLAETMKYITFDPTSGLTPPKAAAPFPSTEQGSPSQ